MTSGASHDLEDILIDLIRFLHQGASADDFSTQLSKIESLPYSDAARKTRLVECIRTAMAVRNRLELQKQRELALLAVIESAQDLSGRLDLLELLRAIVSRARNLLGSDVAWLSVYKAEIEEFQAQVTDGALDESTDRMTARRGSGIAGIVMSTHRPFTTSDYPNDNRFQHDPKLDETFRKEDIASLVGVPLLLDAEVTGLLFVGDRYYRSYSTLEVSILCTLATHAAVAVKNAKSFELANTALRNSDVARAELERNNLNIQAAAEAHEQLTSLLAQGASLSQICQTVAHLLDGSVFIVDEAFQIISYGVASGSTNDYAETYIPYSKHSSEIITAARESRRAGRSVLAYKDSNEQCRVISVIGGDDVLGSVLLFCKGDLNEILIRTFERSSSIVGIALLSQERMEINKNRDVSMLLRNLLSPRQYEPTLTYQQAERFGLNLSQPLSLILIETDDTKAGYIARRLRGGAGLAGTVLDEVDGLVAIVCATPCATDIVKSCVSLVKDELGSSYRGVISKPVLNAEELSAQYEAIRRALLIVKRLGVKGKIIDQAELALYSVLFETHDHASLKAFQENTIGLLVSHDRKRASDLTPTLFCYFDSNQNASVAAKRMNIHVNTMRQRLTSIEEIIGPWGNAIRSLEIHMALRLWDLSKEKEEYVPPPSGH
ncbi:helix-turn-helix domain-containing protein [Noviherbaspirillum sedimenti]|uniref:GAF domain-containing protein n=1 Tax=Noviherbaspirillum sedimenti TaxID=2320865 RepID=A0A3A3G7I6_9BURK|nr:GAF domain-containing protein [Noviherbaspirillum sedimenti]RJG03931.1 GAF domain-containing protein [Noviherbaspirillum sedimenti]